MMSFVIIALAVTAASIASVTDVRRGLIPNLVTLPALLLGLVLHTVNAGSEGLAWAAAGAVVTALFPYLAFRTGGMGGGDVKLFAALGALLGVITGVELLFVASVLAAVQAVFLLALRKQLGVTLKNALGLLLRVVLPKRAPVRATTLTELRMGPAIFLATIWVVLL